MKKKLMWIIGAVLFAAGAACLFIGFWDKIAEIYDLYKRRKFRPKEYDDFADVDEL